MKIEEINGKLVITDFNEFEAYRIACKIEEDGIRFYKKLFGFIDNHGVKETLEFLLAEEHKHLLFFQKCLSALRESSEDPSEYNDLLTSMDYGIFDLKLKLDASENFIKGIKEALGIGIRIEDRSIEFYQACMNAIHHKAPKKELKNIIEEEKKHKKLLMGIQP